MLINHHHCLVCCLPKMPQIPNGSWFEHNFSFFLLMQRSWQDPVGDHSGLSWHVLAQLCCHAHHNAECNAASQCSKTLDRQLSIDITQHARGMCSVELSFILPGFVIIIGWCRVMAVVNFSIVTVLMTIHQVYNRRQSDHQVTVL